MDKKKSFKLLIVSIGCFFITSLSFLLMPIDFSTKEMQFFNVMIGLMFWLSLVMGVIVQIILNNKIKGWILRNHVRRMRFKHRIGLFAFASNKPACIADAFLIISLVSLVVSVVVTSGIGYVCYIFMALLVFSFSMHCILNGRIYYFLKNQERILMTIQSENLKKGEKE